jgi:hypothetical protein
MALSADDRALRGELSEARFAIQRQLEVLKSPVGYRGRPEIILRLKQQLKEIEEALAELEGGGA